MPGRGHHLRVLRAQIAAPDRGHLDHLRLAAGRGAAGPADPGRAARRAPARRRAGGLRRRAGGHPPGIGGLHAAALLAVAAACANALYSLATRLVAAKDSLRDHAVLHRPGRLAGVPAGHPVRLGLARSHPGLAAAGGARRLRRARPLAADPGPPPCARLGAGPLLLRPAALGHRRWASSSSARRPTAGPWSAVPSSWRRASTWSPASAPACRRPRPARGPGHRGRAPCWPLGRPRS